MTDSELNELNRLVAELNGLLWKTGSELRYVEETGKIFLVPEDCLRVEGEYLSADSPWHVKDEEKIWVPLKMKPVKACQYRLCRESPERVKQFEGRYRK